MAELCFEQNAYVVEDGDTVLNSLLRRGHAIPNFCRSGYCQSCLMRCDQGTPLPSAQAGLEDSLIESNHFLACQCPVFMPMTISHPAPEIRTRFVAMVRGKQKMDDKILRLQLSPGHAFHYHAGQYTTLIDINGHRGEYPIASLHNDSGMMEFHISISEADPFSQILAEQLEEGDALEIQTALGKSYYRPKLLDCHLLFIVEQEGLGVATAIIEDALQQQHAAPISLIALDTARLTDYSRQTLTDINPMVHLLQLPLLPQSFTPCSDLQWSRCHAFTYTYQESVLKNRLLSQGMVTAQISSLVPPKGPSQ
jgi:ferredoxin